jgi:hypothetical protein
MGANPTQAAATALFFVSFVSLALAFAGSGIIFLLGFLALMGGSIALFLKCKPWEENTQESRGTTASGIVREVKG